MTTADLARLIELHVIAAAHGLRPDTHARGAHYSECDNSPATVAINAAVRNPTAVAARLAARAAGWAAFVHGGTEAMRVLFDEVIAAVEDRFRGRAGDALDAFWDGIGGDDDQWSVSVPAPPSLPPAKSEAQSPFRIGEARVQPAPSILPEPVS